MRRVPHAVLIALDASARLAGLVGAGFVVVQPSRDASAFDAANLPPLLRRLRIDERIEGLRFHLGDASADGSAGRAVVAKLGFEFQSLLLLGANAGEGAVDGAPDVTVVKLRPEDAASVLTRLRERARPADPTERAVALALDDFHEAAAKADVARYFARFAPEGVFLGTDPDERWTVDAFREWAGFAFERESAWIFMPQARHITLAPDREVAWFDEVLGSAHYGECRGTGVLRRIDGEWRVALYDLTVPIPNDLLDGVVKQIRAR